jgi:hypothetical protein
MTQIIRIAFTRCEDDSRHLEAKAIDLRTGLPIASLPVTDMHEWLVSHGFEPKPSAMVWEAA